MSMQCAICDVRVFKGYFCKKCYKEYKNDIFGGAAWIKCCKNFEQIRRRKVSKDPPMVHLGDKWDIDNDNNLVYKEQ